MLFDRNTIRNLDPRDFSPAEKRYLDKVFFGPRSRPKWKADLDGAGRDAVRWNAYLGLSQRRDEGTPYRHTHERLVHLARRARPRVVGNRVTDFTGWIFSLYLGRQNEETLAEGKDVERSIAKRFGRVPQHKEWELIYEDPLDEKPKALPISRLKTTTGHLWGAPDLVFRNIETSEVLIIERKASNRDIPSDGWPNLRAQLWAYSLSDEWLDAPKVTLVGEVWGYSDLRPAPYLRSTLRWSRQDAELGAQNKELFKLYSGVA
jgi:hypothetical protein